MAFGLAFSMCEPLPSELMDILICRLKVLQRLKKTSRFLVLKRSIEDGCDGSWQAKASVNAVDSQQMTPWLCRLGLAAGCHPGYGNVG